jgi:hypothetical protein|tara:strand:- start:432 stop:638 length:207 start_codon:yes stop_codon:yes gene_type:complete
MRLSLPILLGWKKHQVETKEQDDSEVDTKVNIHTLYKHRWVWYHLILCIQMILTNVLLIAILFVLALK